MASTLLSRRDLDFLLYEWLQVPGDRQTYDAVLDLAEQIATERFATHNRRNDLEEPVFDNGRVVLHEEVGKALKAYNEAGFIGAGMPESVGGMDLPATVCGALMAWFHAANVGTAAYPLLTVANANLLLAHGSQEMIDTYVRPMVEGRYFGTMCLSEPQAGSSLGDITTRAERQHDGSFRITGSKMWISAGEHDLSENIVHLVLAKVPGGPAGSRGISLFVVPKLIDGERNGVTLAGINHKMGFRGTVNTVLSFEDATGYLVGEENRGLPYMFHMMNEARIGVGLGATALGYSGYLHSLGYAKGRPQGRAGGDATTPQVPIIQHPDVRRMLLAQKSYVEGALALELYCMKLVDAHEELLLGMLTPIAKSWPSQWCLEANSLAIQVLGGYGYTREYPVEQLYRDNRLNPIHEGTHGIQALDLLGRKVTQQDGAGLVKLAETIYATCDRAPEEYAAPLRAAVDRIVEVTQKVWGAGDVALSLANATPFLEAVGHTVLAWIWLEQLVAVEGKDGDFYEGKRRAAQYFFAWELPKVHPQLDLVASLDRTTLDMEPRYF
ncbi:MAG: acyl-CoA dehydrogenase [Frankiales bacterium]|nr:acyl-CoA dehydrogenase [Frankiales bacterium]